MANDPPSPPQTTVTAVATAALASTGGQLAGGAPPPPIQAPLQPALQTTYVPSPAVGTIVALAFIMGVSVLALFLGFKHGGGTAIAFSTNNLNVGQTLAPLFAMATFIERAVEIVISTWRDEGASKLAKPGLDAYKRQTQAYAYMISLTLSLGASIIGVRGVPALVNPEILAKASNDQQLAFKVFDIVLTSLLLSGGSDGIHQVVTTITNFLDSTKDRLKQP